jgi:hypothetical protein
MRTPALLLLLLLVPAALAAQTDAGLRVDAIAARVGTPGPRALAAARLSGALRVDGRLDEADWAVAIPATDFTESFPNPGGAPLQRTEARVLYGRDAVYVGLRMYDSAPDSIAAQLARRDASGIYSDWVHVIIDSFRDQRTAFRFSVNPRGVKRDVYHFDDGREDAGWDAVWEVATQIDSLGWTAEYRIPLSQLRFSNQEPPEGHTWGIQIMRDIARYESRYSWSPWSRSDNGFVSRFGTLTGLAGLDTPRRLELRPYTVAKLTRAPDRFDGANPFYRSNATGLGIGGDLQYGITSNLTLTATFNPDFGQVEADPSQVNLSANESFFAERRPFFLEGMDLFRFGLGMGDGSSEQLFYSRRIGRMPQRRPDVPGDGHVQTADNTTILGAVKLTGRTADGWAVGVLNAVTAEEHLEYRLPDDATPYSAAVEPLTNYGIARARRDFAGGRSALGAVLTSVHRRNGDPGFAFLPDAAHSGGVDARHRFGRGSDWELSGWLLGSHVAGDTLSIQRRQRSSLRYFQRPDATHVDYDPSRTSLSGMAGKLSLGRIGGNWRAGTDLVARSPGFETNDIGFQSDADILQVGAYAGYLQNTAGAVFRRWNLFTNAWGGTNWAGERLFTGFNVNGSYQLKNFWNGYGGIGRNLDALSPGALRGGPLMRRPGNVNVWAGLSTDGRKPVVFGIDGGGWMEDETDGHSYNLGVSASWRPSARMDLSLRPSIARNHSAWQWVGARADARTGETRYVFGELDQTTAALTARLNYTFTPELTLQFYAQPFVAAVDFDGFMEVENPRAHRFSERLRPFGADELRVCDGVYGVRPQGGGCAAGTFAYRFSDPSYGVRDLNTNAVVRWEWRPGSTLFLVWQQNRSGFQSDGDFALGRSTEQLLRAPATNSFQVKATYWIGS